MPRSNTFLPRAAIFSCTTVSCAKQRVGLADKARVFHRYDLTVQLHAHARRGDRAARGLVTVSLTVLESVPIISEGR